MEVATQPTGLRQRAISAFTLIELLVVIVIIGVLVALLFPAIKTVILKGEISSARADVGVIDHAIHAYINEYGKMPFAGTSDSACQFSGGNAAVINVLCGGLDATSQALNPRRIVFMQIPTRKGAFDSGGNLFDPWHTQYYIALDCDYNNQITYGSCTAPGPDVVVSFGPNRTQDDPCSGTSDDITNFK